MEVITNSELTDKKKWNDFVLKHTHGNIFQTSHMYEVYKKTKNYEPVFVAVLGEEDNFLGLLLGYSTKEHSGFLGEFSFRTIVIGGPLILDNNKEVGKRILHILNAYLGKMSIFTQFRNLFDLSFLKQEFQYFGYKYEDHLDILNDISVSKEEIYKSLKKGLKKNYNKAVNKRLELKLLSSPEDIYDSYKLIQETYKRVKLPCPKYNFFQNLFSILHAKGLVQFFGAFFENKLISVRVELTYKNLIYDYYTGTSENYKNKYPNDFIPVEVFVWGHKNGYMVFDFGGAGKPGIPYGVRDYKLKFGGELVNFGRFERINNKTLYQFGKALLRFKKLFS